MQILESQLILVYRKVRSSALKCTEYVAPEIVGVRLDGVDIRSGELRTNPMEGLEKNRANAE